MKSVINRYKQSASMQSSVWVIGGLIAAQFLRLFSNLALTRMLIPEYFGIMAIVNSTHMVFSLLSDIGLINAVVNSNRVDDKKFMQTAWTLQLLQSIIISAGVLIASYPMSIVYEEPLLFPLIACSAIAVVLDGSRSSSLMIYQKALRQKPKILLELGAQILSISIMLLAAYLWKSVWVLLVGHFCMIIGRTLGSYIFMSPHSSKFYIEKESAFEILKFGKWVFISSIFGVVTSQADALIMGLWLEMSQLGKYAIAAIFANAITMVAGQLSGKVLHPYFRKLQGERGYLEKISKVRTKLNYFLALVCFSIAILGSLLVDVLYDSRYADAGWMLQILALGKLGHCMVATITPFLFSKGDSRGPMIHQIFFSVLLISLMIVGAKFFGETGVIIAISAAPILAYPLLAYMARRHGIRCIFRDGSLLLLAVFFVIVIWEISSAPVVAQISSMFN